MLVLVTATEYFDTGVPFQDYYNIHLYLLRIIIELKFELIMEQTKILMKLIFLEKLVMVNCTHHAFVLTYCIPQSTPIGNRIKGNDTSVKKYACNGICK